jgi:hypothetical protein
MNADAGLVSKLVLVLRQRQVIMNRAGNFGGSKV